MDEEALYLVFHGQIRRPDVPAIKMDVLPSIKGLNEILDLGIFRYHFITMFQLFNIPSHLRFFWIRKWLPQPPPTPSSPRTPLRLTPMDPLSTITS